MCTLDAARGKGAQKHMPHIQQVLIFTYNLVKFSWCAQKWIHLGGEQMRQAIPLAYLLFFPATYNFGIYSMVTELEKVEESKNNSWIIMREAAMPALFSLKCDFSLGFVPLSPCLRILGMSGIATDGFTSYIRSSFLGWFLVALLLEFRWCWIFCARQIHDCYYVLNGPL